MARHESDREDLIREATALRERVELHVPGESAPVVAGFRDDGRLSLYFGADPAYHFDSAGRLRRAYCEGLIYRSQGTTLARLARERSPSETTLHRTDLDPAELSSFVGTVRERTAQLLAAVEQQRAALVRQVPPGANLMPRLVDALRQILKQGSSLARPVKR
jgi:hypothetical protein